MERLRATYTGKVQGVGFRATTRSIAQRHTLTGWVRNEPDGSVTLESQGPPNQVQAFLTALRTQMGPFIHSVQICPIPQLDDETSFEIRR